MINNFKSKLVVRQPGDSRVVERPVAQRGIRILPGKLNSNTDTWHISHLKFK